jgi:dihydroflavonol-4-reductase
MLTVVTGASGHIGCNLVRALLEAGHEVRALVRDDTRGIEGLEVERMAGDVLEPETLDRAFAGAEVVFHCAANISVDGSVGDDQLRVNAEGPANVAEACLKAGVKKLVHFSSMHAISEFPRETPITEENGLVKPEEKPLPYSRTKALGEEAIYAAVRKGLWAVVLNPSGVIGAHDYKVSHMGETIRDLAKGDLPALIPGGYDFVDMRDVVKAALSAVENGRSGERYLITGHYLTVVELASIVATVSGRKAPKLVCPMWLARCAAPFSVAWGRLSGTRAKFTSSSLQVLRSNGKADHSKATRELGHNPYPTIESVATIVAWQREAGWY